MGGEIEQGFFTRFISGRDLVTQPVFDARLMMLGVELKLEFAVVLPAGEHFGEFSNVIVAVAAVGTEGVQFHHLAGVIFVPVVFTAELIVKIFQHRRMTGGGEEHLLELAKCQLADDLIFIMPGSPTAAFLLVIAHVDAEMVSPEIDDHFFESTVAFDRPR